MKIKTGTVYRDGTCYGNKYYIQIEDSAIEDNEDLIDWVGKEVTIVIGAPEVKS